MSKEIKYINPVQMTMLNNKAIRKNFNRSLNKSFVKAISKEILIPIVFHVPHNDVEVRCKLVVPSEYIEGNWSIKVKDVVEMWLDMTLEDFNGLKSHKVEKEDNQALCGVAERLQPHKKDP